MSGQRTPRPVETERLALALYSLATAVVRLMPRDISLTTAATLNLLEWAGPQRMTQLAAREGVAQPSMTALVGKLEAQGLAERRADPSDARAVLVALTAAGQRYVRDRRRTGAAMLAEVLGDLAEEEASSLCAALPALEAVVAAAERRVLSGGQLATTGRGTHR